MSERQHILNLRESILQEDLRNQITSRIFHPTVALFFEKYIHLGLLDKTIGTVSKFSDETLTALFETLKTHVHKEKPVFISMLGTNLELEEKQIASISMAVDLLWAISLIYDDMFDGDTVRSGIQTVWVTYGKEKTLEICYEIFDAILSDLHQNVGPDIAFLAQSYVQKGLDSLGKHTQMSLHASTEELYQNYHDRNDFNGTFGMHALLLMAKGTTFREDHKAILFIKNLNIASQMLNDIKETDDFYNRGYSDIRNGVVTIPISDLYQVLTSEEKRTFESIYGSKKELTEVEKNYILSLFTKNDTLSNTVQRVIDHYDLAENSAKELFTQKDY